MSNLGWYFVCAMPLLASLGYLACSIVACFMDRYRVGAQGDLSTRLRGFLSECSAEAKDGNTSELTQLREALELLEEVRAAAGNFPERHERTARKPELDRMGEL